MPLHEHEHQRAAALLDYDPSRLVAALRDEQSPIVLHLVASQYNWNDGFEVPLVILRSSLCDFGTALMLFWLAEPDAVEPREHQQAFLRETQSRLLSGTLTTKIAFDPAGFCQWNLLYRRKLEKRGFPSVLLAPSPGDQIA